MVEDVGSQNPWMCLDALVKLLLQPLTSSSRDDHYDDMQDAQFLGAEQLFDKSERNTFAEEKWEILRIGDAIDALWRKMEALPEVADISVSLKAEFPAGLGEKHLTSSVRLERLNCGNVEELTLLVEDIKEAVAGAEVKESQSQLFEFLENPQKSSRLELDLLRLRQFSERFRDIN